MSQVDADSALGYLAGLPFLFRIIPDRSPGRYDLSTPWREGDWIYATDDRLIVRIPREAVEWHVWRDVPGRETGRGINEGFAPAWFTRHAGAIDGYRPVELPAVLTATRPCQTCQGTGAVTYDIPEQPWMCEDCGGAGEVWNMMRVEVVPGYSLMARYVALLWQAGARVWIPRAGAGQSWAEEPAYFQADDSEGWLMPLRP